MKVKKLQLNLNLTSVIVILAVGVLLPVMLATAAGIVATVIAENASTIVIGVLGISFAVTAAGSALIAVVLVGRKSRLARRQADFIASVSHEFRTPLSAIRLYAQTLESGKLADNPEQTAKCIATILRETEWMDVMIDRVLTWRASSRHALELNMERQPITQAVEDAIQRFQSMVPADEISLSTELNSVLPVQHDVRAMNAVVLNLLTNAYKYTGDDKQIRVTARDDDGAAVIEVNDNGIGLTAIEAKRVFQPFYRAERKDGAKSEGVGLGLAIAKHLVGQHGGTIEGSSEDAAGATFTIRLPGAAEESS